MSKKWGVKMEIKMNSISVVIKGKRIFSNITDTMNSGDMVALTGSSGCGKTTLLNCLGLIQPIESGSILINGKDTSKWNDKDKTKFWHKYATFIYQDYGIIEDETVAYNITLDKSKAKSKAVKNILDKVGLNGRDSELAIVLSGGEKQRIGIARAILKNASIIYADEPTASLSDKETNLLFSIIRNLKAKGTAVLYVTHRLEEIMALTDRVTVLRNGELVSTCDTASTSQKELVRLMSGNGEADSKHMMPDSTCCSRSAATQSFPALTISHLSSADHIVKDASITVHTGRITGMFGLCGSGRTEFLECIYGIRRISGGTIEISGEKVKKPTPVNSIKKGIAFICEDRRRKAMIPSFTVEENMNLSSIDHYSKKGLFSTTAAVSAAKGMINALKIRCTGTSQPACELSGGNQQKVVFAKALLTSPSIWLCDEPTQAVDVATRQQIHSLLHHQAAENKAVLYVSSDLTELLEVADEIAVMASGKIRKIFPNKNLKPADILACCYEAEREETHENESI